MLILISREVYHDVDVGVDVDCPILQMAWRHCVGGDYYMAAQIDQMVRLLT